MAMKRQGNSQGLGRKALAAKRSRDLAAANTPARKRKRAENQRIGQRSDSDIHHKPGGGTMRTSIAFNRATYTRGEIPKSKD